MASSFPIRSDSDSAAVGAEVRLWEGRLFGAFRLLAPDGADATPASRKARALVAYLLASPDDRTTRERLAGFLWSERGDDQARASLRQTFYEIRALTSGDGPPIVIDRTRVALVAARVTTDSARLDEAARADDASTLVAVAGQRPAEFLADLDGIDPAFDDWLTVERTRRRDGRRRLMLAVADRRLAAGDADAAQHLADCLLACDPADEAAARIAMQAGYRRGDRDAIRRNFASLTEALRRQVGVLPSDESDDAYRRLMAAPRPNAEPLPVVSKWGGARDDLQATEDLTEDAALPDDSLVETGVSTDAVIEPPSSHRARRWTLLAAAAALLAVAAVEFVGWRHTGATARKRVLLVDAIQVASGDADASALRTGFSAELARVVVGKPEFIVRDADQAAARVTDAAPDQTFVVAADAQSHDGVLNVGLRLLSRKDGPILWSTTLTRPVGEAAALREQMAAKIAEVATCALDGRHTDLRMFRPETLQLLLGACDLRQADSLESAKLLEQLTQQVPAFSHGWAMLAVADAGEDDLMAADAEDAPTRTELDARRALANDPHDGDAYLGRALALVGVARWPQRIATLREGLAQDPDNADLAIAIAEQLAQLGHVRQAVAWSERGIHENPYSSLVAAEHAKLVGLAGIAFGPEATLAFANARRRFGTDAGLSLAEFRYQALVGDHRRAAQMLADPNRGFHLHPDRAALWHALIETRADPSPAHDAEAERAFIAGIRAIPDINLWTLETLSFLHRVDEAYEYADRLTARPVDEDAKDSLFGDATRPLRADPRFMTLAARLGLVAIWRTTDQWPDFCGEPDLGYDCRVEAARALSANPRPLVAGKSLFIRRETTRPWMAPF